MLKNHKSASDFVSIAIHKDFLELYPIAKDAIIFFETHEGKMSLESIVEFRDALDHVMMAFQNSEDKKRCSAETTSAVEHLRRASIEPYEWAVENVLAKIETNRKWSLFHQILLIPKTIKDTQYHSLGADIKKELQAGRNCKNLKKWREGIEHFKRAYTYAKSLDKLIPDRMVYYGRLFDLFLVILGFLLAQLF
jgi:hypothetical protein